MLYEHFYEEYMNSSCLWKSTLGLVAANMLLFSHYEVIFTVLLLFFL